MLHNLTLGNSMSGKTTLNRLLCAGLRARGIKTAVLDPMRDEWAADFETHQRDTFLQHVQTRTVNAPNERWALFIDESGSAIDKYDPRFDWLATTGRHLGCVSHFIAHRFVQLSPNIRPHCLKRWVFNCDPDDARELARRHNDDVLLQACQLPQGAFFLIEPWQPIRRGKVILGRRPRVEIAAAA